MTQRKEPNGPLNYIMQSACLLRQLLNRLQVEPNDRRGTWYAEF